MKKDPLNKYLRKWEYFTQFNKWVKANKIKIKCNCGIHMAAYTYKWANVVSVKDWTHSKECSIHRMFSEAIRKFENTWAPKRILTAKEIF